MKKLALVTGGNRGIGKEVCRQLAAQGWEVWLGSRDLKAGELAAQEIGETIRAVQLDVTRDEDIRNAVKLLEKERGGKLDALINNAGVFLDAGWNDRDRGPVDPAPVAPKAYLEPFSTQSAFWAAPQTLADTFRMNTLSAFRMIQAFAPLMAMKGGGRIINLSSGMGALTDMNGGAPGYRLSKTALNAVTRIFADELSDKGVYVNSVCPGWVKTDMGGASAELSVEEGADTIVWLATSPEAAKLTGGFYRERERIDW
jgi:NAD(P)-dependent dehydrogenase (short-subunit alcohol dehydrogenase family)